MARQQSQQGRTLSGALGTMPRGGFKTAQPTKGPVEPVGGRPVSGVYAGGSPNFDERTGRFIQQPHTGAPVYIPERPGMPPHSGSPIYTPENPPPRIGPGFQAPLERVSPGIYRNASGDYVNSSGGRLPSNVYRQPGYAQHDPNQQPAYLQDVARGALQGIGAGVGAGLGGGMGSGGFTGIGNPQPIQRPVPGSFAGAGRPMPRPVLGGVGGMVQGAINDFGGSHYDNFAGAGQPMPRPVVNYNEPMMYSQGGGYQQAAQDAAMEAQRAAFNQQMNAGRNAARMQPNGRIAY